MTPDKTTPNEMALPEIRKESKIDSGGSYSEHRNYDSHFKSYDLENEESDTTVSDWS